MDPGESCDPWKLSQEQSRYARRFAQNLPLAWPIAQQGEHLGDIFHQMFAHVGHARIVFNVVIAVGQRQSALIDIGNYRIRIVQVRIRIEIKQRIRPSRCTRAMASISAGLSLAAEMRSSSGFNESIPFASTAFSSMHEP